MAPKLWTPADLDAQPVSWLDCDTCRIEMDGEDIVGVYDKQGHSFRPLSGYTYALGESRINGRRWLGGISSRDTSVRLSLGCQTASGWLRDKPGVTVVGTWWRHTLTNTYEGIVAIHNVDASGDAGTTQAQAMLRVAPASAANGNLFFGWRRLSSDTRGTSTLATGLPAVNSGFVLSSRLDAETASASLRAGTSSDWGSLEVQSGITPGLLGGCSRTAYQVMYGFERANVSGAQDIALGEVLLYDRALSDADVAMVEGYLAHRWGVADSLPASHPYKAAPPMVEVPEPESVEEVTEAVRYRTWLPKQAPGWLAGPIGHAWLWAHGDVMDSIDDRVHRAILARFPDTSTDDGLSYIGGERGIARGTAESSGDYATRLKGAWDLWRTSGTPAAILAALHGLGVTNAVLKSEDGRTASLDDSGKVVYTPPHVSSDASARKIRWVTSPDLWNVFQIFIPYENAPWEGMEMPAADSAEVNVLRTAIRRHCGAHSRCDGIVAINYYGSGAGNGYPRLVDWPYRTIDETWGQDESENAWFDRTPSVASSPRCLWNVSDDGAGETADPVPEE